MTVLFARWVAKFPFAQIPPDGRNPSNSLDGRIPQIPLDFPRGEVGTFSRDCRLGLARLDRWEQVVGMIMPPPRLFNSAF